MNRLQKLLAAATLLVLPVIAACGEDPVPPPVTGSIMGQVSIEGMGIDGVSVNLSNGASTTTAGGGTYRFDGVTAGAYTVTISGFPADASFDATSAAATIPAAGGSVTLDFRGSYIRTASIMGTVTVENTGLGGVTVRLSGMADAQTATDNNGQYAFTGLRSGTYSVEISGFDMDEVGFGSVSSSATVGVGESKIISFDGTYLRTAGIMGQVSVEGVGLPNVTVSLAGEGEEGTTTTDAGGLYAFSKLKAGDYSVAISGYDPDEVEFSTTSMNVTVALGETANVPFDGTLLRTSGISGRVSVEGMGLDDVEVVLAGAAEATAMTSGGGQYAFAGLAEGTYVVSMMNPNEAAYSFEETSATIVLGDAESNITNFDGTHTRTASVSGVAYIDEAPADKMYTANEPMLPHAGIPVALQGPGVNDVMLTVTDSTGAYMFSDLMAGSYRALVNMTEDVAAAITAAGFAYKGELTGEVVNVDAGGSAMVNLPFGITMQTIGVGARMGYGEHLGYPVAGVKLAVFANADMSGMPLGEGTTDSTGVTLVTFARADNTGPGGNDNLVFVSVSASGHDDLAVSGGGVIEVSYPATARTHAAPAAVTLVNTRANFQYWVKNNETARGGDMGLEGWDADVYMGDPTAEGAMPLEMGPEATDSTGLSTFTYSIDPTMLAGAVFTVMVQGDQSSEMYDQSDALVHMHNALAHPDMNTMEMNDLGPIRITWTTQTLTVGVYREVDDEPGFTDYRGGNGTVSGDARPDAAVAAEMTAELLTRDARNRLRAYEYDHDGKESTDDISSMEIGDDGMASFPNLPAGEELTVRMHVGSDRMLVGETDAGDIEAFGADLDLGMSTGSFGEASGAGPEVKLCALTTARRAKDCATWAYQWETGGISGSVMNSTGKIGGASVDLTAETDADDRGTKTEADSKKSNHGDYSISDIQDGQYMLSTPDTDSDSFGKKGSVAVSFYHDEAKDDEDEDTEYLGTADNAQTEVFTATRLRQSIKGYVANDNGDKRARGNESMSGVTVNLLKIAKDGVSDDKKDTTFTTAATVETDGSGLYEFDDLTEDLTEGGSYYVEVVAGDDYMGVKDLAKGPNNKSGAVKPMEYPELDEGAFALPSWDYMNNTVGESGQTEVTDGKSPPVVSATLQNFALVFTDNTIAGGVSNLSGSNGGILVEGAMCPTYTPGNDGVDGEANTEDDVAAVCTWTQGDVFRTTTDKDGDYEFDGLTEGYYAVWFTGGGLRAVNLNAAGKPDDDANVEDGGDGKVSPSSHITSVIGRSDYSTRNSFTVYSARAGTDDELTELEIRGMTAQAVTDESDTTYVLGDPTIPEQSDQGTDEITVTEEITFAGKTANVTAKASTGASISITAFDGGADDDPAPKVRSCSGGACEISFDPTGEDDSPGETTITIRVVAGNGYNDHEYTVTGITRVDPEGNTPAGVTAAGVTVTLATTVNAPFGNALTSVPLVITYEPGQTGKVVVGSDALTGEASRTDENIVTYDVAVGTATQVSVTVTITSEDGVDEVSIINLQRQAS